MSPKPKPKASAAPTGTPRSAEPEPAAPTRPVAVPPHTRTEEPDQHPYTPTGTEPRGRADGPTPARPSGRPRARMRGTKADLDQWSRMVSVAALKVGAARRKTTSREEELARVLNQARAAGADQATLSAWLISAGLTTADLPE